MRCCVGEESGAIALLSMGNKVSRLLMLVIMLLFLHDFFLMFPKCTMLLVYVYIALSFIWSVDIH